MNSWQWPNILESFVIKHVKYTDHESVPLESLSAFKAPSLIFVLVWRVILNFITENIGFYCSKGLRVTRYINAHFLVTIFVTNFVNVFVVSHKENLTSCAHNLVDVLK